MLRKVKLENFKSWQTLHLDLAPITGLFGPNSSGKSSLLQFLLMLKQTKEVVDRSLALDFGDDQSRVNLGSFQDVVFQHDTDSNIEWSMTWTMPKQLVIGDPTSSPNETLFSGNEIGVSASVGLRNQQPTTHHLQYAFDDQTFSLSRKENRPSAFSLTSSGRHEKFHFVRTKGRVWDIPGPVKSYAFPDRAQTYFQNAEFLSDFELAHEKLLDRIFHLGPLREIPRREYTWSGARPYDVGQSGERVVDALLAAKSDGERRNLGRKKHYMEFDKFIAYWLKHLRLIDEFSVSRIAEGANLYKVDVRKQASSADVLIPDVGFGVSQVLPVLVLLFYVPRGSIVLLEQPEIHLHPAVQSDLADVIINAVETRGIQVIVESHSEHLLRRLQRRVAEKTLEADQVALYFFDVVRGKSAKTDLKLNLFGEIENWPEHFFGDEFGELVALQKASLRRRISSQE